METVLTLLIAQGLLGAFDTLYFHEWRAKLPARYPIVAPELKLHAFRNFIYAILFLTLPTMAWHGTFAIALALLFCAEIGITILDFTVEDVVRKDLGGVYMGERITHALIAVNYCALIALLVPILWTWWNQPPALVKAEYNISTLASCALYVMGLGLLVSGCRDLLCAFGFRVFAWPWKPE